VIVRPQPKRRSEKKSRSSAIDDMRLSAYDNRMKRRPSKTMECRKHGLTAHGQRNDRGRVRWRCRKCEYEAVKRRRRKLKEMLVEHFGGKCIRCGYNTCLRALSFHHRTRSEKSFSMDVGHRVKWETLLKEAEKCDLLCANCHMELEEDLAL